ncbi:MAG: patatin-like phospholipase family protein [Pirellulales bacterium]
MTFRILSIDGGGIRGLIPAILLERMDQHRGDWLEQCDLITGTSTGGILALGLAAGLAPSELRALYEENGPRIFDDSWLDDLLDLGKLVGADYSNRWLRGALKRIFGQKRLGDLRPSVLIPTFDLDNEAARPADRRWKPKLFHNMKGPGNDRSVLAYKVALYTSAAPTYFPSEDGYIDGGVYANNPSMCALAQSLDSRYCRSPPSLEDIRLVSLGTGSSPQFIRKKRVDWGYAQWASPLLSVMYDGVSGIADYQCRQILGDRYFRLAPVFPEGTVIPLDGVDRIADLVSFAESVRCTDPANRRHTNVAEWLKEIW